MAIYKIFDDGNDVISNVKDTVSSGMWENGSGTLTAFYTSSTQSGSSGEHYLDVYGSAATTTTRKPQFSVAYGHFNGSGSLGRIGVDGNRAAASVYRQLSQTLLGPTETQFTFAGTGGNITPKFVYAISVAREFLREKMDPGNWELHISSGSRSIRLIDDSDANINPQLGNTKREFNVVSGSVANGVHTTASTTATSTNSGSYGLFYPELGMIILNPNSLASGSVNTCESAFIEPLVRSTGTNDLNHRKLLKSIESGSYFSARREEQKRSSFYFCDVLAGEFNHSQNPSFFTGSNAELVNNSFKREPTTYITTVGLYNDNNELLAVAKMSKPFKKDANTEALIKVRLDY